MLIDMRRCIGCNACGIACKAENRAPPGVRLTGIERLSFGRYPNVARHFIKKACLHCKDPVCVRVCPSGAMAHAPDGRVTHDIGTCIGCGYCAYACPFEVPRRSGGKAHKCTMCQSRLTGEGTPACVATCPTGALSYGPPRELTARGRERLSALRARFPRACLYAPPEVGGTSVQYVLTDDPEVFGLPRNPTVAASVAAWQGFVKPYAAWLIPAALLGSMISFAVTRLARRKAEQESGGEEG